MNHQAFIKSMSVCLFLSAGAAAADPEIDTFASDRIDWQGLYSGVYLGGGGANRYSIDGGVGQDETGNNTKRAASGIVTLALTSGYNFQVGRVVIGVENDLNLMRKVAASDSSYISLGSPALPAGVYKATADSRDRLSTSLRLRVGYAINRMQFYVTGGVTRVDRLDGEAAAISFNAAGTSVATVLSRDSGAIARTGFEVGVGSEYAFGARFVGRLEYLYAGYGSVDERYSLPTNGAVIPVTNHVDGYTSIVRAGIAYRF
jgi:opacity protein-like surface antigen